MSLSMDGVFFLQCNNSMPDFVGESRTVAVGGLTGWNRIADTHGDGSAADQCPDPNGSTSRVPFRHTGTSGTPARIAMKAAPSLNDPQFAIARSAALGKNQQRNSGTPAPLARPGSWSSRRARASPRGTWMCPARRQMPAEKRDLKESALGQEAELHRDVGEHDGRVHVAKVVGHENVAAVLREIFSSPSTLTFTPLTRSRHRAQAAATAACRFLSGSNSETSKLTDA